MVKITDGISVFEVTKGAFDGIYSHQGFKLLDEVLESAATAVLNDGTEDDEDMNEDVAGDSERNAYSIDELENKPLNNWTKAEAKFYAKHYEIDLSEAKNFKEAKAIIAGYLED